MSASPDLRAALMRLLVKPEALTDDDLSTLSMVDARWRDRALERRAAAKQAAAAPPAKTITAALVRIAEYMGDAADLIAGLHGRDLARAEEVRALTTTVEALRVELDAVEAAQEVVRD